MTLAGSRYSNRTKAVLVVGLVVISIALLAVTAEVAVRIRQFVKYGSTANVDQMYEIDSRTGLRVPKAGSDFGHIQINARGFRSPTLTDPKALGSVRLAFLGASTTFCAEVSSNQATWPYLVADSLRKSFPGKPIDFINGGVPGYAVKNSTKNLQLRVAPLNPDMIVIYVGTNDLSWELRAIAASQGTSEGLLPPEASWLSRYSLLWGLVSKNLRVLIAKRSMEAGGYRSISLDAATLGVEFRNDLIELIRAAKATSRVVAVATFSTHMRFGQDQPAQQRAMQSAILYMPGVDFNTMVTAYRRYNEIIREVARTEGVILIDGEDQIPGDPEHFVDSVHFTDAGSRAQAQRVSQALIIAEPVRRLMTAGH